MQFFSHHADSYFRFVNDDDIVPRVPPGYDHAGNLIHFDSQGFLERAASDAEAANVEAPPLSEAEYFEQTGDFFRRRLGDHSRNADARRRVEKESQER